MRQLLTEHGWFPSYLFEFFRFTLFRVLSFVNVIRHKLNQELPNGILNSHKVEMFKNPKITTNLEEFIDFANENVPES